MRAVHYHVNRAVKKPNGSVNSPAGNKMCEARRKEKGLLSYHDKMLTARVRSVA